VTPWTSLRNGRRDRRQIALTFDDGPGPFTPAVCEALDRHGVRATFFVLGKAVKRRPDLLPELHAAGHEIGNHSMTHARLSWRPLRALREIWRLNSLVRTLTGFTPRTFRAPYGNESRVLVRAARLAGTATVGWDVDSRDWEARPKEIAEKVMRSVSCGSIVVMHDGGDPRDTTVEALDLLLPDLQSAGYRLVTVSELLDLA
jgi:peptidoglycan/xylan/chitin deacetylase (PgdA/CDA1 family)